VETTRTKLLALWWRTRQASPDIVPVRASVALRAAAVALVAVAGAAWASSGTADAPTPAAGAATTPATIKLPALEDLQLSVPRPVRAATAALGYGRQRLALVVGIGTLGSRSVVDSAARDSQAVAAALRNAGYVVMLREDVTAADLRAALQEFRSRLQPDGVGFVYAAGLGAQVDGHNLLLPRDVALDAGADAPRVAAALRAGGVPLAEFVDALQGPAESPRLLVVDAAYAHPVLGKLPVLGLAEQRLPPGVMALFGHALAGVKEVPAVAPLPLPAPTEPQQIAASAFAATLVKALATPRISGPEALRSTRRALVDPLQTSSAPWLGGDTDGREEFAEATLLDGLIPRTPEEVAREGARTAARSAARGSRAAGERSVAEVLQAGGNASIASGPAEEGKAADQAPTETARRTVPEPGAPTTSALGTVGSAVGAVGTVAGVAATVAAGAAVVKAAEVSAQVQAATTVASTVTTLAGNAVALAARVLGGGEQPAREAVQTATVASAAPALLPAAPPAAPAPTPTAAPVAPPTTAAPRPQPPVRAAAGDLPVAQFVQAAAAAAPTVQPTQPARDARTARSPAEAADGRTQRQPGGGERPAYVPRVNDFGYAEGDTFTYRITDTWKGEVTGEYTQAIEEVLGDGRLLANGQQVQLDPQGRLVRRVEPDGSFSRFEPHQDLWWSNPQRGQSRAVKFVEQFGHGERIAGSTEYKGSTSVGRLRKIETPAGEFEAMPIESSGWWTRKLQGPGQPETGQWSRTVWYSPKLGHPVAIEIEDADRLGKLLRRERIELLHAQVQRAATP
jgi:uncharacterized caspase-like protein